MDNIYSWITAFDEETDAIDQRLAGLSEADNQLSMADDQISQQVSELDSRLDERMINRVLATPWQYFAVAFVILLAGICIGVFAGRITSSSAGRS